MTGFAPDWLALREPHDRQARSQPLAEALAGALAAQRRDGPLEVLDLGCGTGANLRALAPLLATAGPRPVPLAGQHWRLVDDDPRLLDLAAADPLAVRRTPLRRDLAAAFDAGLFDGVHLVTASALLDLVSAGWIERLVRAVAAVRADGRPPAVLFTLSYDGTMAWMPPDARDAPVLARFNRHQRGDKGFGPAEGPMAGERMAGALAACGYRVARAASPWRLPPAATALQAALIDGTVDALSAADPAAADWLEGWRGIRQAQVAAGRSSVTVGHLDLLGVWTADA